MDKEEGKANEIRPSPLPVSEFPFRSSPLAGTLLAQRELLCHSYLAMLDLCMTPHAVYLFLGHMFFVHELHITVFFRSLHMTEITFFFWGHAITLRHFRVALIAFVTRL